MSQVEALREFVSRRLSDAAGEIFSLFLPTLLQYQEKIQTQQRPVEISHRETTKSQRTDEPHQHFCEEEQLWNEKQHSSLDREEAEPPQVKEEQEEAEPPQIKEELLGESGFDDTIMVTVVGEQSDPRENLDSLNSVRELITQRLTAAAKEIYTEFQQTVIHYQEEIQTQQRLPEDLQINLHRTDDLKQLMNSSLEHKESETPQIKEDQEEQKYSQIKEQEEQEYSPIKEELEYSQIKKEEAEFNSSHAEEQLVLKQEEDYFMVTTFNEQSQPIEAEPESEPLLSQESFVAGSQHQKQINLVDSGLSTKAGLKSKNKCSNENAKNSTFSPQSSLTPKKKRCTVKIPHSCKICGQSYKFQSDLLHHMTIHSGENPHLCVTCGKNFRRRWNLLLHMKIHSGEKPHSCETCGKRFIQKNALLAHMRTHTGENPHSCVTCGKSFGRRGDLLIHMRIHSGEKPYSCATCGKSFTQRGQLLVHMNIHTGERPHTCVTCGKSFTQRGNLLVHMRIHSRVKPKNGVKCGKSFPQRSQRLANMSTDTGEKQ